MAAIEFSTMKTRLALQLNNLQSNDPHYTYLGDAINEAANALVLMAVAMDKKNINLFKRLRDRRFEDVTVNNQGYLDKPDTLLVADSLTYTKVTTSYAPSRDTEYPTREEPNQERFGLLNKASTTVGYPAIWNDAATQILIWPTPTTTYLTTVVLRGIKKEAALSAPGETFVMEDDWHPVIIDYAQYLMMQRMNMDDADKVLQRVKDRIGSTIDPLGLANRKNRTRITIAGTV